MNTIDDHDATSDELSGLGARLRSAADHRPGDLDRLGHRIRAERQRTRLALVTACAAVLIVAVAFGMRAGDSTDSLDVGGNGETSISAAVTEVPMWTVNPSIPADPANGEVWGIDVVYDPAVWDYEKLTTAAPLDMRSAVLDGRPFPFGSASFHDEPRMQAYWQGPDAQQSAEAARDELLTLPGIVSVEVGLAEPTSRPPGTSPVVGGTFPSTTVRPLERRELPDPRPTQDEILADGVVTDDEYGLAFWTWVECAEGDGAQFDVRGIGEDGRYVYRISSGIGTADACYQSLFAEVDRTWQVALDAATP